MSLPSNGSLALSEINRSVRFTNGNLGIGTTAPSRKLDIHDSTEATINLQSTSAQTRIVSFNDIKTYFQSSGDIEFTGIDTTTLRHLYLATSGNVGIGTETPQTKLHVNGSSLFGDYIGANLFFNAGTGWTRGNASNLGFALRIGSTGDIYGNGLQTFMLDNGVLNTNLFMVGANGSVGIGTVNPGQRLDVAGGRIQVSNSGSAVYEMTNSAGTASLFTNPTGSVHLTSVTNRNIILNANELGIPYGTVGICTSNPNSSVKLHVNGNVFLPTHGSLWIAGTEDQGTNRFRFHNYNSGSVIDFVGGSLFTRSGIGALNILMILTTAGNLGINATSGELLTVGGDTDIFGNAVRIASGLPVTSALINLGTSGTRDSRRAGFISHTGTNLLIGNQEPGMIDIAPNNGASGALQIKSNGNVSLNHFTDQGRLRVHATSFPNLTLTTDDNFINALDFDSTNRTGGVFWRVVSTHQNAGEGTGKFVIMAPNNGWQSTAFTLSPETGRAGIGTFFPAPPNGLQITNQSSGCFQLGPSNSNGFHMFATNGELLFYSGTWGAGSYRGKWYNNGLEVAGYISKSSGTFDIQHPLHPDDTNNRLVHSFIEGPRCDLIYRGQVTLTNGTATVNLDTDCVEEVGSEMSSGTFEALCTNPQFFLQNKNAFTGLKGNIQGNILTIQCENTNSTDTVYWTVIAERKDDQIKSWGRTNTNGYLKTEYVSENSGGSIPTRT